MCHFWAEAIEHGCDSLMSSFACCGLGGHEVWREGWEGCQQAKGNPAAGGCFGRGSRARLSPVHAEMEKRVAPCRCRTWLWTPTLPLLAVQCRASRTPRLSLLCHGDRQATDRGPTGPAC